MCIILVSILEGCLGKKERIVCKSSSGIIFETEIIATPESIVQNIIGSLLSKGSDEPRYSIEAFLEIHNPVLAREFHELLDANNTPFFDKPPKSEVTSLNYATMKDGIPFSSMIQYSNFDKIWKTYTDKANKLCQRRLINIDDYKSLYRFFKEYDARNGPFDLYFEMFIASKFMKTTEFIEKYEKIFVEAEDYEDKEHKNKESVIDYNNGVLFAPDRSVYDSILKQLQKP